MNLSDIVFALDKVHIFAELKVTRCLGGVELVLSVRDRKHWRTTKEIPLKSLLTYLAGGPDIEKITLEKMVSEVQDAMDDDDS